MRCLCPRSIRLVTAWLFWPCNYVSIGLSIMSTVLSCRYILKRALCTTAFSPDFFFSCTAVQLRSSFFFFFLLSFCPPLNLFSFILAFLFFYSFCFILLFFFFFFHSFFSISFCFILSSFSFSFFFLAFMNFFFLSFFQAGSGSGGWKLKPVNTSITCCELASGPVRCSEIWPK